MSLVGSYGVLFVLLFIGAGALLVSSLMQFLLARKSRVLGLVLPAVDLIAIPVTCLVLRMLIGIGFGRTALVSCIIWMIPMVIHLVIFVLCCVSVRRKTAAEEENRKKELDQMQIQDL